MKTTILITLLSAAANLVTAVYLPRSDCHVRSYMHDPEYIPSSKCPESDPDCTEEATLDREFGEHKDMCWYPQPKEEGVFGIGGATHVFRCKTGKPILFCGGERSLIGGLMQCMCP